MRIPTIAAIFATVLAAQSVRVGGRVVATDGKPIDEARVRLQTLGGTAMDTQTDVKGAFTFESNGTPSALIVEKTGFSRSLTTQLDKRDKLTDLFVRLEPVNSIAGRVLDADGNPVAQAKVTPLGYFYARGERSLFGLGMTMTTAADGSYRLDNLTAGRYYVQVEGLKDLNTTYYPSTLDTAAAGAIELDSGTARSGIDIRMHREPTFHIKGNTVNEGGEPVANITVSLELEHAVQITSPAKQMQTTADGSFEFEGLVPGTYVIRAVPRPEARYAGRIAVAVTREDINEARVVVNAGRTASGSVAMEDSAALPAPAKTSTPLKEGTIGALGLHVRLTDAERNLTQGNAVAAISLSDGTFRVERITPGKFFITIEPLPPNVYVKSMHVGGLDVTRTPLDLIYGGVENLRIVLASKAAEVRAAVHDREGKALPGVLVALWPDVVDHSSALSGVRVIEVDANGVASFRGLRPEKYHLAAFVDFPVFVRGPDFLDQFKARAEAIDAGDGAVVERSIEPISREDAAAVIRNLP